MPNNARIVINGIDAAVTEIAKLPIIFNKEIDMWASYVGTFGTSTDNTTPNISIPYSKVNTDISGNSGFIVSENSVQRRPLPAQMFVDGAVFFAGTALLKNTTRGTSENVIQFDLQGDNLDLFSQLNNTSLRDLDLGTANTDHTDMRASWTALAVDSNPIVWQPISYGGVTTDTVSLKTSSYQYQNGLRPAVRIWKIIEAIFTIKLGYTIISTLYEREQFKNMLYFFGVGDLWKRADNYSIYKNYIGKLLDQNTAISGTFIDFDNEGGQFSDPQNLNTVTLGGTYFDSLVGFGQDGWYQFSFLVSSDAESIELVGVNLNNNVIGASYVIASFAPNQRHITEPILFTPNRGLTRLLFRVQTSAATCNISAIGSYYQAQLLDRFAYGAPLLISSCLHEKQVKDFLRGLQHAFNLVFYSDSISKTVWFEPRFAQPSTHYTRVPQSIYKAEDGYYDITAEPKEICIDASKWVSSQKRPFGNHLQLNFANDTSDGLLKYYNEQIKPIGEQAIWAAQFNFNESGKDGQTKENPFFSPLMNIQISNVSSGGTENFYTIFPCIIEDINDIIRDYDKVPTFESSPKFGQYYGVLDFSTYFTPLGAPQYNFLFFYENTRGVQILEVINEIPSSFQVFPDWKEYFDQLGGVPFNLSFGDILYNNASVNNPIDAVAGLVSTYIDKYFRCIDNDIWLDAQCLYRASDFYNDDFRVPYLINFGAYKSKFWLTKINQYAPLQTQIAELIFIQDANQIGEDSHDKIVSNQDPYMFILDQNVLINK